NYATSSDSGTTFGGAYTLFGVIELREDNDLGSWAPTKRGASGSNYDYAGEAGKYQLMVNYPGNTTEPGSPYMTQDGDWVLEDHPIPGPQFTSQGGVEIDCLAEGVQCGFMTIGAHGQRSSGVEVFTPVEFAGEQRPDDEATDDPTVTPTPTPTPSESPSPTETQTPDVDVCAAVDVPENEDLVVVGEPLEATDAVMTVEPGRYLPCDRATEVTVSGSGYDHTEAIYLGFGTPSNHDDLEQWRRSNGGLSGADADYDYGLAQMINGSTADVEDDAVKMDASGNWSIDILIPGKDIESFFGSSIDCSSAYCGFFSFGSMGMINAANEAYTPVYFGNQDPSGTPEPNSNTAGQGPSPRTNDDVISDAGTIDQGSNTTGGKADQNLADKGNLANTGFDGHVLRTMAIGAALLLSAGLFALAFARYRKRMI
ncbi:MAG: hypothetical protein L0J95_13495, partial [Yaniella sp.]|nr:hypothetical protein [Yaniella sp.]